MTPQLTKEEMEDIRKAKDALLQRLTSQELKTSRACVVLGEAALDLICNSGGSSSEIHLRFKSFILTLEVLIMIRIAEGVRNGKIT